MSRNGEERKGAGVERKEAGMEMSRNGEEKKGAGVEQEWK